jgi:uncharacterized protein (UPF0333 family)
MLKGIKNKKGQASIEYVIITLGMFLAFVSFYSFYSKIVPRQFEKGAQIILAVFEGTD